MIYAMKAVSLKIAAGKFKKDYSGTKIRVSLIKKAMLEKEKTRSIVNVLLKNNIPAIINTSRNGLEEINTTSGNIFFTNNLPYNWLFPKIYAVVHHGGCGTTHTALKYGLPSLIIPHVLDQFFWGKTISILKLGPRGISIRKFNEKDFEYKILDLYANTDYKKNAFTISKQMQIESDKDKLFQMIIT